MGDAAPVVNVHVVKAVDLINVDVGTKSDPYVLLHAGKHEFHTKVKADDLNPVWNEQFAFDLTDASRPVALVVEVNDKDLVGKGEALGSGTVSLDAVRVGSSELVVLPMKGNGKLYLKIEGLSAMPPPTSRVKTPPPVGGPTEGRLKVVVQHCKFTDAPAEGWVAVRTCPTDQHTTSRQRGAPMVWGETFTMSLPLVCSPQGFTTVVEPLVLEVFTTSGGGNTVLRHNEEVGLQDLRQNDSKIVRIPFEGGQLEVELTAMNFGLDVTCAPTTVQASSVVRGRSGTLTVDRAKSSEGFELQGDGRYVKREYYKLEEPPATAAPAESSILSVPSSTTMSDLVERVRSLTNEELMNLAYTWIHQYQEVNSKDMVRWCQKFMVLMEEATGETCYTVWQLFVKRMLEVVFDVVSKQVDAKLHAKLLQLQGELQAYAAARQEWEKRRIIFEQDLKRLEDEKRTLLLQHTSWQEERKGMLSKIDGLHGGSHQVSVLTAEVQELHRKLSACETLKADRDKNYGTERAALQQQLAASQETCAQLQRQLRSQQESDVTTELRTTIARLTRDLQAERDNKEADVGHHHSAAQRSVQEAAELRRMIDQLEAERNHSQGQLLKLQAEHASLLSRHNDAMSEVSRQQGSLAVEQGDWSIERERLLTAAREKEDQLLHMDRELGALRRARDVDRRERQELESSLQYKGGVQQQEIATLQSRKDQIERDWKEATSRVVALQQENVWLTRHVGELKRKLTQQPIPVPETKEIHSWKYVRSKSPPVHHHTCIGREAVASLTTSFLQHVEEYVRRLAGEWAAELGDLTRSLHMELQALRSHQHQQGPPHSGPRVTERPWEPLLRSSPSAVPPPTSTTTREFYAFRRPTPQRARSPPMQHRGVSPPRAPITPEPRHGSPAGYRPPPPLEPQAPPPVEYARHMRSLRTFDGPGPGRSPPRSPPGRAKRVLSL